MPAAALKQQDGPTQSDMALHLLSLTHDMTGILNQESTALGDAKKEDFEALSKRKAELFSAYGSAMSAVQALGQAKLEIDDALKKALREATVQFKTALERNQSLLKAQLDLSQGMMSTIGKEVERQQNPMKTYGNPASSQRKNSPTSLALNQTI